MQTVIIRDGGGNELARGQGRKDWRDIAARIYDTKLAASPTPRSYCALVNTFLGGPIAHVQFGHYQPKAGTTSLSPRYVVEVVDHTF